MNLYFIVNFICDFCPLTARSCSSYTSSAFLLKKTMPRKLSCNGFWLFSREYKKKIEKLGGKFRGYKEVVKGASLEWEVNFKITLNACSGGGQIVYDTSFRISNGGKRMHGNSKPRSLKIRRSSKE